MLCFTRIDLNAFLFFKLNLNLNANPLTLCSITRSVFVKAAILAKLTLTPYVVTADDVAAVNESFGLGGQLEPGDKGSSFTFESSMSISDELLVDELSFVLLLFCVEFVEFM